MLLNFPFVDGNHGPFDFLRNDNGKKTNHPLLLPVRRQPHDIIYPFVGWPCRAETSARARPTKGSDRHTDRPWHTKRILLFIIYYVCYSVDGTRRRIIVLFSNQPFRRRAHRHNRHRQDCVVLLSSSTHTRPRRGGGHSWLRHTRVCTRCTPSLRTYTHIHINIILYLHKENNDAR